MSLIIPVDEHLIMRLMEPQHAEEIYAVVDANREHVGRWMPWVELSNNVEDARKYMEISIRDFAERRQIALAMMEHGQVVGGIGWTDWKQNTQEDGVTYANADIGYWIAENAQGRGIVTKCVARLLDIAFNEYGLNRMTIRCEPENERSGAVARRLGFTHEGTLRHLCKWDERWVNHELYSMLAHEWQEKSTEMRSVTE